MNEPSVTEAELARVLELDAKATPGPWFAMAGTSKIRIHGPFSMGDDPPRASGLPLHHLEIWAPKTGAKRGESPKLLDFTPEQRADAQLIEAFRTLCPRIARELADARAAMDKAGAVFISMNLSQSSDWPKLLPDIREAERAINAALNTHTHE